jgi:hypothetical protein
MSSATKQGLMSLMRGYQRPLYGPWRPGVSWKRSHRALERELGRLQGLRELEAVAESTLRESLERERQRRGDVL